MRLIITSLLVFLVLVSCGATEPAPYRDTTYLELPPGLQESYAAPKQSESDDSAIPDKSKIKKGLGDTVYLTTSKPPQIKIKQIFDLAWNTLDAALKQSDIEITDRELDKGLYYVTYDADSHVSEDASFADSFTALLTNDYSKSSYVLTVTADGDETIISAALADQDEHSEKPETSDKTDGAEKLLQFIFETMRDDLVEE